MILHQRECAKARGTQNLTKTSDKQKALMKKQPWESCIPPRPFPTISFFSERSLHAFISVLKKKKPTQKTTSSSGTHSTSYWTEICPGLAAGSCEPASILHYPFRTCWTQKKANVLVLLEGTVKWVCPEPGCSPSCAALLVVAAQALRSSSIPVYKLTTTKQMKHAAS